MKDYNDILNLQNEFLSWLFKYTKLPKETFWQMDVGVPSWNPSYCNAEFHFDFVRRENYSIGSIEYLSLGKYNHSLSLTLIYNVDSYFKLSIYNGVTRFETDEYTDIIELFNNEKPLILLMVNDWVCAGGALND